MSERMWKGLELELATQFPDEHMPFGKSYYCPWADAVCTTAERESTVAVSLTAAFIGCA